MDDYRTNWTLPALPLGPAIRHVKPPLGPSFLLGWFERDDHKWIVDESGVVRELIEEHDCRQIKGAAQGCLASGEVAPSARPVSPVAASPAGVWQPKVGDRVRTKYKNTAYPDGVIGSLHGAAASVIHDGFEVGNGHLFAHLEPIPAASTPAEGEWVAWERNERPPALGGVVTASFAEVRLRNGYIINRQRGQHFEKFVFEPGEPHDDVMAYRIVKP